MAVVRKRGSPSKNPLHTDYSAGCDGRELPDFPQPLDDEAGARKLEVAGHAREESQGFQRVPLSRRHRRSAPARRLVAIPARRAARNPERSGARGPARGTEQSRMGPSASHGKSRAAPSCGPDRRPHQTRHLPRRRSALDRRSRRAGLATSRSAADTEPGAERRVRQRPQVGGQDRGSDQKIPATRRRRHSGTGQDSLGGLVASCAAILAAALVASCAAVFAAALARVVCRSWPEAPSFGAAWPSASGRPRCGPAALTSMPSSSARRDGGSAGEIRRTIQSDLALSHVAAVSHEQREMEPALRMRDPSLCRQALCFFERRARERADPVQHFASLEGIPAARPTSGSARLARPARS